MSWTGNSSLEALHRRGQQWLPRLLTQVCRDSSSPFYGCFDRNWWHYKIRDFPSIILQQGGYALYLASLLPENGDAAKELRGLAAASARFWNTRAIRHGAFEEYYPWEQGYPPLAFSTLAVTKLVLAGVVASQDVEAGLSVAARQLLSRFEPQAANQQIAGLAALAGIRQIFPDLVPDQKFLRIAKRSLALQNSEGWFVEYDGPDLGYLTVTIDCLWDLWDWTKNTAYRDSIHSAWSYLRKVLTVSGHGWGMHNARNTDYLVPYGIGRHLAEAGRTEDWGLFQRLYDKSAHPDHFFGAVDDRYISHYIGHSIFRALCEVSVPKEASCPPSVSLGVELLPESGHVLRSADDAVVGGIVSLRKGGILSLFSKEAFAHDFGWLLKDETGRLWVTHWWSPQWEIEDLGSGCYGVSGWAFPHREQSSEPWKHFLLRCASFLFGYRIIRWLKRLVIFKKQTSGIQFRRRIELLPDGAKLEDQFQPLPEHLTLHRAGRASKRHVASADSFHPEDFCRLKQFAMETSEHRQGDRLIIRTLYRYLPEPPAPV